MLRRHESSKEKLKAAAVSVLPLVFVTVYYELLLNIFAPENTLRNFIYPAIFAAAAGLAAAAAAVLLPAKARRVCTTVFMAAEGILFTAECLVKKTFSAYMTVTSMLSGAKGVVTEYSDSLAAIVTGSIPVLLLFFSPPLLYGIFVGRYEKPVKRRLSAVLAVCAAVLLAAGALLPEKDNDSLLGFNFDAAVESYGLTAAIGINARTSAAPKAAETGFIAEAPVTMTTAAAEQTAVTEKFGENKVDVPSETRTETSVPEEPVIYGDNVMDLDFGAALSRDTSGTAAELNAYVQTLTPTNKNKYTGLFEGKNLVLICAEAFSDVALNEELTPNLWRLAHNGIYFSEYYQPSWGGSTTTGEFSFTTGLVPETGLESMQKISDNNNYFTLGNQLQRQGYASCAVHNGMYDYYSRNLTHTHLGYDQFLAYGSGLEDIIKIYSEDTPMIEKTLEMYIDKQPFSLYYMSVSGHFKYTADNHKVKNYLDKVHEVYGNKYKEKTNYYLCYQMEFDNAVGVLLQKLEEAGIADDTVICITADHYPYGLEENPAYDMEADYVSDLYGYKHTTPWEKDHNSWFLWSGCLENEYKDYACEISVPTYSLDIVPTLSNLFGLEYDSRLLPGRDVFSDAEPLVVWNNRSWATDKGKYYARTKEFFPAPGFEYNAEYIEAINNAVSNKIRFSYSVVNSDYYGALFGPDEIDTFTVATKKDG